MTSLVIVIIGTDIFGWEKALAAVLVFWVIYIVIKCKLRVDIEAEKNKE